MRFECLSQMPEFYPEDGGKTHCKRGGLVGTEIFGPVFSFPGYMP